MDVAGTATSVVGDDDGDDNDDDWDVIRCCDTGVAGVSEVTGV